MSTFRFSSIVLDGGGFGLADMGLDTYYFAGCKAEATDDYTKPDAVMYFQYCDFQTCPEGIVTIAVCHEAEIASPFRHNNILYNET